MEDSEVWVMSSETFSSRAESGCRFSKPVLTKEKFSDSGDYSVGSYATMLRRALGEMEADVHQGR